MEWIVLIIAGLLETGWATTLRAATEKPAWLPIVATAVLLAASMILLAMAMRSIPLGVAYPIWTGIGAVGSVVMGVVMFRESLDLTTVAGVGFLILGMVLIGGKTH